MLELRTLGGLHVRDSQGHELRAMLAAPKQAALFTYLAIATPRGFHRRDTLLALLWPELDQEHARGALRWALHSIRHSVTDGTLLRAGDEEIGLDWDGVWCDAVAFEAMLDEGRVQEALEVYRGDLLEGFHLSGCPEFERWLDSERRRLKERAAEATWSLAEGAEAVGQVAKAAHWGRRAAALSPDDEGVLRRVIELLDRAGDRAGAIREYEAFAKRLREDYEAEPAPETTALIESVRAREQANGGVLPSAPVTKQAAAAPVTSVTVEARRSWRTRGRAASVIVALGAIAVAGATVIGNGRGDAPALDPTRVLVDIFQNETGDPSLDHLGRMATDRVTAGLTLTSFMDVVSLGTRLLSRQPVVPDTGLLEQADLQALARANGTGTVVSGSYYLQGDSVHFLAHVTNAATGEELAALEPVVGAIDTPVAAVEQLRDRVMTTLATLTDHRLAKWMRYASKPPTFEAYTEFVEGIELHMHQKPREALPHFLAAAALDSTFTMASLWAVNAYGNSAQWALRDSIGQALNRRRGQLAPLDRLLLDFTLAYYDADYESALEAMRRFVEIAPGSEFLYEAGHAARMADRPGEAIEFLTQADPESGWLRGWLSYWFVLNWSYHRLGDHERELELARRGRRQFPDAPPHRSHEIRALAAMGRIDEVNLRIDEALEVGGRAPRWVMWVAAHELRGHGYRAAGMLALQRHVEWLESRPPEAVRFNLGVSLMLVGRLDEARKVIEETLEVRPEISQLGILAELAAREGRPEEVLRISRLADSVPRPQGGPAKERDLWHRATIAVALGDRERAMTLLRAFELSVPLHTRHQLEPLWDYPPFQELVRRKG